MHEFPLADTLLDWLKQAPNLEEPILPELYSESEFTLNGKLKHPRVHMQGILKSHGRPHATLHSFRRAFNNALRDLGLALGDRQALLAHASSDTTLIYTSRNLELARRYVDQIPEGV